MNEFVAKKLGEVWAFSRAGGELQKRSGEAFGQAVTEGDTFVAKLNELAGAVEERANDITNKKAEATTAKLTGMMEAYIGDEWDNPTELLEWLSFFLGSGAAHWSLVAGAGSTINDDELVKVAEDAVSFYNQELKKVQASLRTIGTERAKE